MSTQYIPITGFNTSGVNKDTPAVLLPSNGLTDAENIRFTSGSFSKMSGELDLIDNSIFTPLNGGQGVGKLVHITWWANPNIGPSAGYFIVVGSLLGFDSIYVINSSTQEIHDVGVKVPAGGDWQDSSFQGGYAIILNNGIARPFYLLDETGNTVITNLKAFELPGWDSYYTKEEAFNDTFEVGLHIPDFDLGRVVDFSIEDIVVDVIGADGVRKFSNIHTSNGTIKQSTIFTDTVTNSSIVSIALTPGGVGQDAFAVVLEDGDNVVITVRSKSTVQVRAGVIRAWGDTLVAGNLVEINAPTMSQLQGSINTIVFSLEHGLEVGDKLYITSPITNVVTISNVVNTTTVEFSESIGASDYTNASYTIVSSGKAIRNQPGVVRVSDVAAPGSIPHNWNPYTSGVSTAEEFQLSTTGTVKELAELQGNLYVYTSNSIHSLNKTGNQNVPYIASTISSNRGALGMGCVQQFNGIHIVVGTDDIYQFSGHPASIKSMAEDRIGSSFYSDLSPTDYDKVQVIENRAEDELWVCYPSGGATQLDKVWVFSIKYGTWTLRTMTPFNSIVVAPSNYITTGTTLSSALDNSVLRPIAITDADIYGCDFTGVYVDRAGVNYESYVERVEAPMTPEFDVETVTSMSILAQHDAVTTDLRIRLRTTDGPAIPIASPLDTGSTGSSNVKFVIGQDYKSDIRLTGRMLHYRLTDEATATNAWTVSNITFEVGKGGRR